VKVALCGPGGVGGAQPAKPTWKPPAGKLKFVYEASRREAILERDFEEGFPASSGICGNPPNREASEASNVSL
jgi:hypothetical protein